MTRDEGVAHIKRQLAFRQTLDTEIVAELKLAQTMLELGPVKPWFLISNNATALTTANQQQLSLPTNFLLEVEDAVLTYIDSDNEEHDLVKDEYDVNRVNFKETDPGVPKAYSLLGNFFQLFPVPADEYTIRMMFYKQDTVLTSNVENGWLKYVPYLLLGTALKQIAEGPIRDTVAGGVANGWISAGMQALNSRNVDRSMTNTTPQMGGRHN